MTGRDLAERRRALGISQQKLADTLGVPQSTIGRWETGALPIERPAMLDLALRALESDRESA